MGVFEDIYVTTDVVEESFSSKLKLREEIFKLYASGVVFSSVVSGVCLMRPEIEPVTDCTLMFKVLDVSQGSQKTFCYRYEEVKYEALRFS